MSDISPVWPFGTSIFFVFFVLYAIWLICWRPKNAYGAAWKLASTAFCAGLFLAMLIGTWVAVTGMLIGLSIILSIWTVGLVWMAERLMIDRIALDGQTAHISDPRLPSGYRLQQATDRELIALADRTYGVLFERNIHYDFQPATEEHVGTTTRLTTPGE
jgi:hypothetical protein